MSQESETQMVATVPDYIAIRRYDNSLAALKKRYPEECPSHIIAQALCMTEAEVESLFKKVLVKLRDKMGVI
jgi:hypothetical protein